MRVYAIPTLLIALVSCTFHKLEVRLNGQPTQSMEARVDKEGGRRIVDLLLPGGFWSVSTSESGLTTRIIEIDGRRHVRIGLPSDRLLSSRPLELILQGLDTKGNPAGAPYLVSLDYNSRYQKASRYS